MRPVIVPRVTPGFCRSPRSPRTPQSSYGLPLSPSDVSAGSLDPHPDPARSRTELRSQHPRHRNRVVVNELAAKDANRTAAVQAKRAFISHGSGSHDANGRSQAAREPRPQIPWCSVHAVRTSSRVAATMRRMPGIASRRPLPSR